MWWSWSPPLGSTVKKIHWACPSQWANGHPEHKGGALQARCVACQGKWPKWLNFFALHQNSTLW